MKKINYALLIMGFSVSTISLVAQSAARHLPFNKQYKAKAVSTKRIVVSNHKEHKPTSGLSYASMQYPNTEQTLQSSYSLSGGWELEGLNRLWTVADTGTGTVQNFDLAHNATVAFDTIWDYYSNNGYSAASGSVTVDTITALVSYENMSTKNDTVVFYIMNVLPSGYPGTTVLHTDTVILNKGGILPGNSVDTIYEISVTPFFNIPTGTKFAVTLQYSGSKLDTFNFAYAFPYQTCSSTGYIYANTFTYIGPAFGSTPYCNSFVNGWGYYEYPTYAATTWPDMAGNQAGSYGGSNAFDNDEWNSCGADTEYFYWQDNAIYANISFNSVTGINTISNNGLSVSQNFPNPFDKTTQINYSITKQSDIAFTVYDVTGRKLVNNNYTGMAPGQHVITLDAMQFTPGIYFYTFNINGVSETKKMIISE